MSIMKDKTDFERCIPEAIKKAEYWLWLKKSSKEKIFESFNNVRDNKI